MEDKTEASEGLGLGGKIKYWLQDNIRLILAVLIVAALGVGIYSYSQRGIESGHQLDSQLAVQTQKEAETKQKEEKQNNESSTTEEKSDKTMTKVDNKQDQAITKETEEEKNEKVEKVQVASGEETGDSFLEVATQGDSLTTLARRATKHYLEKNPVPNLTKEHKIYIEDYLVKHINHRTLIQPGEKVEFSKDLIKEAIAAAQQLNDRQLENLKKYSQRVSDL